MCRSRRFQRATEEFLKGVQWSNYWSMHGVVETPEKANLSKAERNEMAKFVKALFRPTGGKA